MRCAAVGAILLAALAAYAEEMTVPQVVSTIRFHPWGEPASTGFRFLSRRGGEGWNALAGLTLDLERERPEIARRTAAALAEGPEKERLSIAAGTYARARDPLVRAALASGLAFRYEEHRDLLVRHLVENRPGAADLLSLLAPSTLPEPELRSILAVPDLAPISYAALRARGLGVRAEELVPWAREIGRACLGRRACDEWASRPFDPVLLRAVALALAGGTEESRDGALCLLLTVSGKRLPPDTLLWESWIAASGASHRPPPAVSEGRIAAAVIRGARALRRDLLEDGRCIWSADPDGHWAVGATALAVLALRAAGDPRDHPAIEAALRKTLLVPGTGGPPALPEIRDRGYETYCLALLAIALADLDPKAYRIPLAALHRRLVTGMQPQGQWSYQCRGGTDGQAAGTPDNSNTQYAVLALRALARAGFPTPPEVWRAVADFVERTADGDGDVRYRPGQDHGGKKIAMLSAGIGTLSICLEALLGPDAPARIQESKLLRTARATLGRALLESGFGREDLYSIFGVERACVLTATREFRSARRSFDWYAEGARDLLARQDPAGHWGFHEGRRMAGSSYGPAVDTAYAILFLTKATATIAGSGGGVVEVSLPPGLDQPPPSPAPPAPAPPAPPEPPLLLLEFDRLPTRDGTVELAGTVAPPDAALLLDGRPLAADARGRFLSRLRVEKAGTLVLEARAPNGLSVRRDVEVSFDSRPPSVALLGPPLRRVGTQVLVFRADEELRSLKVGGRVYPAAGRVVRAAVEIGEGPRTLVATATDLAGNEGTSRCEIEARNRVLVLDGSSAAAFDLREAPGAFTLECHARGDEPGRDSAIVSNARDSGFGLYWSDRARPFPFAIVRAGNGWPLVPSDRPPKPGRWTHLALCYDGATLRFYVGGRLQGSSEGAPFVVSGHRLLVGAEPLPDGRPHRFFRGAIDEVRVSRVVRYREDFVPRGEFLRDPETVLLLHFDVDEAEERIFLDDSGRHCHGAPIGAPALVAERR